MRNSHPFREKIPAGAAVRQSCWFLEEAEDVCFLRMGFLWWVVCWGPRVDWDMVFCKAAVDLSRSVMGARSGMSRSLHSSSPAWAILTSSRRLPSESLKGTRSILWTFGTCSSVLTWARFLKAFPAVCGICKGTTTAAGRGCRGHALTLIGRLRWDPWTVPWGGVVVGFDIRVVAPTMGRFWAVWPSKAKIKKLDRSKTSFLNLWIIKLYKKRNYQSLNVPALWLMRFRWPAPWRHWRVLNDLLLGWNLVNRPWHLLLGMRLVLPVNMVHLEFVTLK